MLGSGWLFVLSCLCLTAGGVPLNDFIGEFEGLSYSEDVLMTSHHRLRRTVHGQRHLDLMFQAFDRSFHFKLYPDASAFSDDFKLSVNGKVKRDADLSLYYSGRDVVDPSVMVRGDLSHGVFVGTISTPDQQYHIEPAHHHFKEEQNFHSIIYRSSDIKYDAIKGSTCGLSDQSIFKKMVEDQKKAIEQSNSAKFDHQVHKRQQSRNLTRSQCRLLVVGDQRFYEAVSTPSFPEAQRINQAKAFISRAVLAVTSIYENTVFYHGIAGLNRIGFELAQVDILTTDTGFFADEFIGVQAFLERFSRTADTGITYSNFCAVYRFTYRDFSNGVLGLAYVAQSGTSGGGGICSATLNTGLVTLLNFGRRVPENINQLTFAHELGHNFGSGHDSTGNLVCAPGSSSSVGNFIMFESSSSGNDPNNDAFSNCSITAMDSIIAFRAQMGPGVCFSVNRGNCGNGVIDEGEDCDCVHLPGTMMCADSCCDVTCNLTAGATCSPDNPNTVCCTAACTVQTDLTSVCRMDSECANESRCDGVSAMCPGGGFKTGVNGSALACQNDTGTCINETCTGSLCLLFNLAACSCSAGSDACSLCCMDTTCKPISQISQASSASVNLTDIASLPPGSFCLAASEAGYCDFEGICTPVDGDGALNKLADFFTSQTFQNVIQWIIDMWWVLVIAVVALLVVMFVIVLICHFTLPKPKHQKERAMYRDTIKSHRASQRGDRGRPRQRPPPSGHSQPPPYQNYEMYTNAQ